MKYLVLLTFLVLPSFALAQDNPAICYMATGSSNTPVNGTYIFDGSRDSTCDGGITSGTAGVWKNENGAEAFVVGDGPYPTPSYYLKFEGPGCFGGYYNHNGIGFAGQTYGNGGDGGTGPTVTEVTCPLPPGTETTLTGTISSPETIVFYWYILNILFFITAFLMVYTPFRIALDSTIFPLLRRTHKLSKRV